MYLSYHIYRQLEIFIPKRKKKNLNECQHFKNMQKNTIFPLHLHFQDRDIGLGGGNDGLTRKMLTSAPFSQKPMRLIVRGFIRSTPQQILKELEFA